MQLQNIFPEMQSLKQDKTVQPEVHEEVWCLKCKGQGHEKYHCSVFVNYIAGGEPIPLRSETQVGSSTGPALWCAICQVARKHMTDKCHLLQKLVKTPKQLFYNFCRSVGHDENNCRSYEFMMDITTAYRVQAEMRPPG